MTFRLIVDSFVSVAMVMGAWLRSLSNECLRAAVARCSSDCPINTRLRARRGGRLLVWADAHQGGRPANPRTSFEEWSQQIGVSGGEEEPWPRKVGACAIKFPEMFIAIRDGLCLR